MQFNDPINYLEHLKSTFLQVAKKLELLLSLLKKIELADHTVFSVKGSVDEIFSEKIISEEDIGLVKGIIESMKTTADMGQLRDLKFISTMEVVLVLESIIDESRSEEVKKYFNKEQTKLLHECSYDIGILMCIIEKMSETDDSQNDDLPINMSHRVEKASEEDAKPVRQLLMPIEKTPLPILIEQSYISDREKEELETVKSSLMQVIVTIKTLPNAELDTEKNDQYYQSLINQVYFTQSLCEFNTLYKSLQDSFIVMHNRLNDAAYNAENENIHSRFEALSEDLRVAISAIEHKLWEWFEVLKNHSSE